MPEEAVMSVKKEKKCKMENVEKLNALIIKLEEQLALMTPKDLKKCLIAKLKVVDANMEELMKSINDIYTLLGIKYKCENK